jgi:hypothetical protein
MHANSPETAQGSLRLQAGPTKARATRAACRLATLIAFSLLLAGCDSCGDWVSPLGSSQTCRQQAPRPQ